MYVYPSTGNRNILKKIKTLILTTYSQEKYRKAHSIKYSQEKI